MWSPLKFFLFYFNYNGFSLSFRGIRLNDITWPKWLKKKEERNKCNSIPKKAELNFYKNLRGPIIKVPPNWYADISKQYNHDNKDCAMGHTYYIHAFLSLNGWASFFNWPTELKTGPVRPVQLVELPTGPCSSPGST